MAMIELTHEQAEPRIKTLLVARESRTLDFKRVSGKMVGKALEGVLVTLPSASRQQARYTKPMRSIEQAGSLSKWIFLA